MRFVIALLLAAVPAAAQSLRVKVAPETGFVDDAFALDGSGGRLAYVRSDGAAVAELVVVDLDHGGAPLWRADLAPHTMTPARLAFVPAGLLVFSQATATAPVTAFLFDDKGKLRRTFGPASDVAAFDRGVTLFDRKGADFEITAVAFDGRRLARRVLHAEKGVIRPLGLSVLYWRNGYTQLVGRKQGDYDTRKDRRMNDSEGVYDVVRGALARDKVIGDVVSWTEIVRLRGARPNQGAFVWLSMQEGAVEAIATDDRRVALTLGSPLWFYDPSSLAQEELPGGRVAFSMTIDPLNPDAMAQKRRDAPYIELYLFEGPAKPSSLGRLLKDDRPVVWRYAGGRWALLRKHKTYARGGPVIEVYDLK